MKEFSTSSIHPAGTIFRATKWVLSLMALFLLSGFSAGCNSERSQSISTPKSVFEMNLSIVGKSYALTLDSDGKLSNNTELATLNRGLILKIEKGTRLLDKTEKPLSSLSVDVEIEPPSYPAKARFVSAMYTIEPRGVVFEPPMVLSLEYNPALLPVESQEDDLYIMSYDDSNGWGRLDYNSVDITRHLVTARISQSGKYVVLSPSVTEQTAPIPPLNPDMLEITYFHSQIRCFSCIAAEDGTRYTLENYFKDELDSGKIVYRVIDLGDEANAGLVIKYGAFTSSLFINSVKDGTDHIFPVNDIWFLTSNKTGFVNRLKSKIDYFLTGAKP